MRVSRRNLILFGLVICTLSVRADQLPAAPVPTAVPAPARVELRGEGIYALARGAVFKLTTRLIGARSERSHGTAFVVGADGLLATNYHVVAEALAEPGKYELALQTREETLKAKVVGLDPVNDIAIVRVATHFEKVLNWSPAKPSNEGETFYSVGFPREEQLTLIQGNFNGVREMGFAPVVTATMPLNPGMSGGPCFNTYGEVVGVNRAMVVSAQNLSYFSPGPALATLIARSRTASPSNDWKHQLINDILLQERRTLAETNVPGELQRLNGLTFRLPFTNVQCGQDQQKVFGLLKLEFLRCQTLSLALLSEDDPALNVVTVGVKAGTRSMDAFSLLQVQYEIKKKRHYSNHESSRQVASVLSLARGEGQPVEEVCGARNVRNPQGVDMRVRYCTIATTEFSGLYSTFVRVNVLENGKVSLASFAQLYDGLSLPATHKLLDGFLNSITWEKK